MLCFAHPTGNALGNIDYLFACPETGEALAVDPWDPEPLVRHAREHGWTIRSIVNTHAHWDHTRGNAELCKLTGAQVFCHPDARPDIGNDAQALDLGARIALGKRTLRVLDTPGHTLSHVCLLGESESPFLVSGDTLFNAGAGNCKNGGDPELLYQTFSEVLASLSDDTLLYPGHNYLENNLGFALDREPGNQRARAQLDMAREPGFQIKTLRDEREYNPFFRLHSSEVLDGLRAAFPQKDLGSPKSRFVALRALRDRW